MCKIIKVVNFMLCVSCVCVCVLLTQSCLTLCDPWTIARQVPLSMGFSRQEYWSGLPFSSPGIFLTQGSNSGLPHCQQSLYPPSYQGIHYIHTFLIFFTLIGFSFYFFFFPKSSLLLQFLIFYYSWLLRSYAQVPYSSSFII